MTMPAQHGEKELRKACNFEVKKVVLDLLSMAKKRIDIQMAYFGDKDITDKIIKVADSGITVNIVLPQKANIQSDLNYQIMTYILGKTDNVNIYLSRKMMHSKILYIDGRTLLVGSANLNCQATKRLCELDVLIHGTNLPFKKRLHN